MTDRATQAGIDLLNAVESLSDVMTEIDPEQLRDYIAAQYPQLWEAMFAVYDKNLRLQIERL